MTNSWKFAWAACLVSTVAFGDGPLERTVYVGPEVGANFLSFGWSGFPIGHEATPGVRASYFTPGFAVGADVSLGTQLGFFSGNYKGSLNLGAQAMPYFMTWGDTRAYGLGGLNLGLGFN